MKNKYGGAKPKLKKKWLKEDIKKVFTSKESPTYSGKDPKGRS